MQRSSLIAEAVGKPATYGDSFTPEERAHAVRELRLWFELDTWTMREALLLLAGIDPHRADCWHLNEDGFSTDGHQPVWARITARPGVTVDDAGMPHPTGLVLDLFQIESLSRLLNIWVSNPGHTLNDRHAPSYYLGWAVDKGYGPFWHSWMIDAGLFPERTTERLSATPAAASEGASTDPVKTRQDSRLARLRELGGDRVWRRSEWRTTGGGALAKLEAELRAAGDKRFSEKSIREDITEAAKREQAAQRSGYFHGLGSR